MRKAGKFFLVALVTMTMAAGRAHADALPPMQIIGDPALDNVTLLENTPSAADLIAMYVAETDQTIDITWEVVDLPDASGGVPEGIQYYFEFQLDDPDGINDAVPFSLRAKPNWPAGLRGDVQHDVSASPFGDRTIGGGGSLQGDCSTTGNVTSCRPIRGSYVKVTVDDVANTITASMRRIDLRDASGKIIAVDGAVLSEREIFRGPAICMGVVLASAALCDVGDMDVDGEPSYVLGTPRG